MALGRVNLVDAIADSAQRISQSRTATLRKGWIAGAAANGVVNVRWTIDAADPGMPCLYLADYTPTVGDRVVVISDRDMAVVLNKLA